MRKNCASKSRVEVTIGYLSTEALAESVHSNPSARIQQGRIVSLFRLNSPRVVVRDAPVQKCFSSAFKGFPSAARKKKSHEVYREILTIKHVVCLFAPAMTARSLDPRSLNLHVAVLDAQRRKTKIFFLSRQVQPVFLCATLLHVRLRVSCVIEKSANATQKRNARLRHVD